MKGSPGKNKVLTDFIRWVLSDGQKYVNEAGYIALPNEKIKSEIERLK
jgi:phosphate transport system substrate-binding protein